MTKPTSQGSIHWVQLDILRGLAALLMVVNHVGYKSLVPNLTDTGLSGMIVFIGSFAPVLFFFVTGVGYGIQSFNKNKPSHWYVIINKVVILIIADLFMRWIPGKWLGLDFLGFIALSSLVLEVVRNSRSPVFYCIIGFVSVSLMRYAIGPFVHNLGYDLQAGGVLGFIFGTYAIPGISYPLSPWLAFPFAGYLIGVTAMRYKIFIENQRWQVIFGLLIFALFPSIGGLIFSRHNSSFFRWGTVAIGFYIVSFAVILIGIALSLAICRTPWLKAWQNNLLPLLFLRGIASFAVVPVHYFLIYLLGLIGIINLGVFNFFIVSIAVLIASFYLARRVEKFSYILGNMQNKKILWFGLVAICLLTAIILFSSPNDSFVLALAQTFGQLVLCLLFAIRPPSLYRRS